MRTEYNIGDTVYTLIEDVIRPVAITKITVNKYGIIYDLEHINSEGFKLVTSMGEKFVFKKVSHLIIYLMEEYEKWWNNKEDYELSRMPTNISTKEKYI